MCYGLSFSEEIGKATQLIKAWREDLSVLIQLVEEQALTDLFHQMKPHIKIKDTQLRKIIPADHRSTSKLR